MAIEDCELADGLAEQGIPRAVVVVLQGAVR